MARVQTRAYPYPAVGLAIGLILVLLACPVSCELGVGPPDEDDSIWSPLPRDAKGIVGICLAAVFIAIAAGSGLGGGGILVPLYMTFLALSPVHSVALSNVTILGSSIMNVAINSLRSHPLASGRRMIDWEIVLLLEPGSILGTVIGGFLNKSFPQWLSLLLMLCFLLATSARTFKKAIKLHRLETNAKRNNCVSPAEASFRGYTSLTRRSIEPMTDQKSLLVEHRTLSYLDLAVDVDEQHCSPDEAGESPLLEKEAKPMDGGTVVIWAMCFLQAIVVVMFLLQEITNCGDAVFWTITACFFPLTLAFGLFSRAFLMRLHKDRVAAAAFGQYSFLQGDVQWDAGMFKIYPLVAVLAGVIASWFGVGGGTVKGPLLMHLGILPEVVAATSSAMMVFTTFSSVAGYIAMRRVLVWYALLMFAISMTVTLAAQLLLKRLINKLGRPSVVVFLFASVCLLGAGGVFYSSFDDIANVFQGKVSVGFNGICSPNSR